MADAIREAYGDLFLIKEHPVEADKPAIQGKFKSFHNVSDNVASLMMKNFYALLELSDLSAKKKKLKNSCSRERDRRKEDGSNRKDRIRRSPDNARTALQHSDSSACHQGRRGLQRHIQITKRAFT